MRVMFRLSVLVLLFCASAALAQAAPAPQPAPLTLRALLLKQLHASHDTAEWFTPVNTAVAGLTAEQAKWMPTDKSGKIDPKVNHSAGMLANHLLFWNRRVLHELRGEQPGAFDGNNDETFNAFDAAAWNGTVKQLEEVLRGIEQFTEKADEAQLAKAADTLSHVSTHNAYHTGQIMYVRKLQGVWDPAKAVK